MCKIKSNELNSLNKILKTNGYQTIAPTVRDYGIIYHEISYTEDLPID